MSDAYRVLKLTSTATHSEIRAAYLELACQHHPCKISDQQPIINSTPTNHTQFRLAAEAYALIGDDSRRQLYDMINSLDFTNSAGRPYHQNLHQSSTQELGPHPTPARSRARSELTIDLRVGLPPELRTILIDLDPVKLFNQVVCQIDQERRAQQHQPTHHKLSQSKYLSTPSRFPDERLLTHNNKSSGTSISQEPINSSTTKPLPLNSTLKTGILRDHESSKYHSRKSPTSIAELLNRDHDLPYPSSILPSGEPIRSSAHSTSSSSYISNGHSTTSSHRNHHSRRVSFSNDVIESEQLKQAREAVKSFKSQLARIPPKPTFTSPSHSRSSSSAEGNPGTFLNNFGSSTTHEIISRSSSSKKPNEFFLDKSLYSDLCSPIHSIPQDILIKPIGISPIRHSHHHHHHHPSSSSSPHSLMAKNIHRSQRDQEPSDEEYHDFLASSAPTGFLSRYRTANLHLNCPPTHHHHHQQQHHHHLQSSQHKNPPEPDFPWSDPNFDNPRSILINNRPRDPN